MQTSAISQRVADFLRRFAPFDSIPQDDLIALCQRGRVKFHESDEFVYWQKTKPNPFVYLVQRGAVSLVEEHEGGEQLRDLLGAGDLFGVERFRGATHYETSARTNCDVVLYAFHAQDFEQLLERHPHIGRFLAAQSPAGSAETETELSQPAASLGELLPPVPALVCPETATVGEAARALKASSAPALAIVDHAARAVAVLEASALLDLPDPNRSCGSIADRNPLVLSTDMPCHDALLALAGSGRRAAIVTADGTPETPLIAVVTVPEITAGLTAHPQTYLDRIPSAPSLAALHWLHGRARQAMLRQLTGPKSVTWLAQFGHLLDRAILRRILTLLELDGLPFCWCFFDAAGRQESLTAATPSIALIGEGPRAAEAAAQVQAALSECGFQGPGAHSIASLDEWKDRFSRWIADPIEHDIHHALPLFDLSPAAGDPDAWMSLSSHIEAELRGNSHFTPLLANDALANLPPLTFFEDLVVDESGRQSDRFDLERTALQPLVDVGRLLGAAAGFGPGFSTSERLGLGNAGRAADDALRSVLFYQARSGLRYHTSGNIISPKELGRLDRQSLKATFRTITQLLQAAERLMWQDRP